MIRYLLIHAALFLVPFALYAGWLWAVHREKLVIDDRTLPWLAGCGLLLVAASLWLLAVFSGAPSSGQYVPPVVKDGQVIPGHVVQ